MKLSTPQPYADPYLAGIALGLVLLAAFVIMGRGLGASGAFSSVVTASVDVVSSAHARANPIYREYLPENASPIKDWIVFEIASVIIGGFISGLLAGRVRQTTDRGPRSTPRQHLLLAFSGGIIMGFGAKLARGCSSGQGLNGGALLSVRSWVFMDAIFASAYAVAYFVRREWT